MIRGKLFSKKSFPRTLFKKPNVKKQSRKNLLFGPYAKYPFRKALSILYKLSVSHCLPPGAKRVEAGGEADG